MAPSCNSSINTMGRVRKLFPADGKSVTTVTPRAGSAVPAHWRLRNDYPHCRKGDSLRDQRLSEHQYAVRTPDALTVAIKNRLFASIGSRRGPLVECSRRHDEINAAVQKRADAL